MQKKYEMITKELLSFIEKSPTAFHVVNNAKMMFREAGLTQLREDHIWKIEPGKGYFVVRSDSSVIAFKVPKEEPQNFQLVASHSDSPAFKVKEHADIKKAGHYVELNVEKYGGMLMAPWFDRPLSIAGRVLVNDQGIRTQLIDFDRDLVMIPSLAIHMNRQANEGIAYKVQNDLLPIIGDETAEGSLQRMTAKILGVKEEAILGSDLFLYSRSKGCIWGANDEYVSCGRLDDLQCAFTSIKAFLSGENADSVTMCCIFDNEEVGSGTKQGADSTFLENVMERIVSSLGYSREKYLCMIAAGFMLSADNAHAVHPNHIEKADPTNQPYMNGGVVVKYNANQKYTTDAVSAAIFGSICQKAGVPIQTFVNHSDVAGGSTLGNIANAHVSLNTIDIGAAQLAMHSAYETAGSKDTWYLFRAMEEFYNTNISMDEKGNYILKKETYPQRCACCEIGILQEAHEICGVCGWEDDAVQNKDPDFAGGANEKSLNDYRLDWEKRK